MDLSQSDLLAIALRPLQQYVIHGLATSGWSPRALNALAGLLNALAMCALVWALVTGLLALQRLRHWARTAGPTERAAVRLLTTAIALVALSLLLWIIYRPSPDIGSLVGRLDHVALCALGGYSLSLLSSEWRKWVLSAVSACILLTHAGWVPVGAVMSGALLGYAALTLRPREGKWVTAGVQGGILLATLAAAWRMRSADKLVALGIEGLFAFVVLRHISFVVEARRGYPTRVGDYLCYMLFYPSCYGASEVYNEFHDRNLREAVHFDYSAAVRHIVWGKAQMWLAVLLPVSFEATVQLHSTPLLWLNVLVIFVRSSLFIMGFWAVITACALLYGVELRPNFVGILRCENASQFWHSWRATMTNWLIRYVYIPLGGNRRRQGRNIGAAFAVSTVWHWMGLAFLLPHAAPLDFVPMGLWGSLNALGVLGYVVARRRGWQFSPAAVPPLARRGAKIFLTACLGTLTVTLLGFGATTMQHFGSFLWTLSGLRLLAP